MQYELDKPKVRNIKSHTIEIPMYKCGIEVIFHPHSVKLEEDWRNEYDHGAGCRDVLKQNSDIILEFFEPKIRYTDIAHECTHIAQFIFKYIGQEMQYPDEPFAYLVGHIFQEVVQLCKKQKIRLI